MFNDMDQNKLNRAAEFVAQKVQPCSHLNRISFGESLLQKMAGIQYKINKQMRINQLMYDAQIQNTTQKRIQNILLTPPAKEVQSDNDLTRSSSRSAIASCNTKVTVEDESSDEDNTQSEDIDMEQKEAGATRGNLRSTWFQYRDMCEEKIGEIERELEKMELTVKHKTKLRNQRSATIQRLKERQKHYYTEILLKAQQRVMKQAIQERIQLSDILPVLQEVKEKMKDYRFKYDNLKMLYKFQNGTGIDFQSICEMPIDLNELFPRNDERIHVKQKTQEPKVKRGRGRPLGVLNKSKKQTQIILMEDLQKNADPLEFLAEL